GARIAAKRLRYALDLVREAVPAAARAARRLRALQDILGEFNDLRGLRAQLRRAAERAALARVQARLAAAHTETWAALRPAPPAAAGPDADAKAQRDAARQAGRLETGYLAAAQLIERRRSALFERLHADWLGGRCEALLEELHELLRQLLGMEAAGHPEIERK